jgi:hypothetical protein
VGVEAPDREGIIYNVGRLCLFCRSNVRMSKGVRLMGISTLERETKREREFVCMSEIERETESETEKESV